MNAKKMTNEEIAKNCERIATVFRTQMSCVDDASLREAAARLRNKCIEAGCYIYGAYKSDVADLRRRLKVAEDALEFATGCITRDCLSDCDHIEECDDGKGGCLCSTKIEDALAAIRKEKGESK